MRITFYKLTEQRVSYWVAEIGKRTRAPGSAMALGRGGMPHDLLQLIVEASVGVERGFWGSVAAGATFRSTGRRRTRPGRAVAAAHRDEIVAAEHVVHEHLDRWRAGQPTPAAEHLDAYTRRWERLAPGQGLVVEWPSLVHLATVDTGGRNPITAG
jgi:hypothetical protein